MTYGYLCNRDRLLAVTNILEAIFDKIPKKSPERFQGSDDFGKRGI